MGAVAPPGLPCILIRPIPGVPRRKASSSPRAKARRPVRGGKPSLPRPKRTGLCCKGIAEYLGSNKIG